jgi:hypothetical protein
MNPLPPAPPVIGPARPTRAWRLLGLLGLVGLVGLLAVFDPAHHGFYPRCYFKMITGLNCPGCGGLRAAHQLLHGHLRAAFALNPILFLIGPILAWLALAELRRATSGRTLAQPFKHPAWVWGLLALMVGFGILRNLPLGPFAATGP